MLRYLTPVRLCLLVLLEIYISGEVPNDVRLNLLTLFSSLLILPSDRNNDSVSNRVYLSSSDITTLSDTLSQHHSNVPGRNLYDQLLRSIWTISGPDGLFHLFSRMKTITTPRPTDVPVLTPARISCFSPLGQFIRRCCYEFERLQFADVQKLWSAFEDYRMSSYATWSDRDRNATFANTSYIDSNTRPVGSSEQRSDGSISTEDVDTILSLSIHQLQRVGGRVPANVKTKLQEWFESQIDTNAQSLKYFMAFFEHWRAAQMSVALESLHQYFDYSADANHGTENLKVYFQYAQLHQSVLYADFECWTESANAMSECIATARENQDTACLNFALSWLLHLRQVHPNNQKGSFEALIRLLGGSTEYDGIAFLKAKAREGKHWPLMSSTLLEEAKLEMYNGGNTNMAFEHLLQSTLLNVQHDQQVLMPASNLFESSSFERLGQSRLSYRICESTPLDLQSHTPLNNLVQAACRMSHLKAQMGHYASAKKILDDLNGQCKGVLKLEQRVSAFRALAELKQLVHLHQGLRAKSALLEMSSICPSIGPEVESEFNLLNIQYLLKEEDYETAMQAVNAQIAMFKHSRTSDIAQRLHLLIMKSKIFTVAGQSAKGFSLALRAASTAQRHLLLPVLVAALHCLSRILVDLEEFDAARMLAEASIPHALGMADLELRADLFSCLVDAHVGLAYDVNQSAFALTKHLHRAITYADRSCAAYAKLEDRSGTLQCLTKKVQIALWLSHDAMVEQASGTLQEILISGEPTAVFEKVKQEAGDLSV